MKRSVLAGVLVGFLGCCGAARAGTEAPVLASVEIDPGSADVTTGPAEVVVRLRVTDTGSGFALGFVTFYDAAAAVKADVYFDSFELVSGDEADGLYEVAVEVAGFSAPGTWELEVFLTDLADNAATYGRAGLALPGGATGELVVVNTGSVDAEAPVVGGFVAAAPAVDVSANAARAVVEFDVADAGSGFATGAVFLEKDGVRAGFVAGAVHRVSGDAGSGRYRVAYWVPAGAPPGDYRWNVQATDVAGNVADVDFGGAEVLAVANGGAAEVGIFGEGPVLEVFEIGPTSVDVGSSPAEVSGRLVASDDATGFAGATVLLTAPAGAQVVSLELTADDVVGGEVPWGVDVPAGAVPGEWSVEVFLRDGAENWTFWGGEFGEALPGGAVTVAVANGEPPPAPGFSVAAVRLAPGTVDVTAGAATVAVEVDVVDPGGAFTEGRFDAGVVQVVFGQGDETAVPGTYAFELEVPPGAAAGDWPVVVALATAGGEEIEAATGEVLTVVDGAPDAEAPRVVGFGFTGGGTADITGAPAAVEMVVLADDGAGTGVAGVRGRLVHGAGDAVLEWADGAPASGAWSVGLTVPAGSQPGAWYADVEVWDVTGNVRRYGGVGAFSAVLPGAGADVLAVSDAGTGAYAAFVANYGGVGASGADDDGDGLENGLELLLGTDPTEAGGWAPAVAIEGGELVVRVWIDRGALTGSAGAPLAWRALGSGDLGDWSEVAAEPLGAGRYRLRGGGFVRLGVDVP